MHCCFLADRKRHATALAAIDATLTNVGIVLGGQLTFRDGERQEVPDQRWKSRAWFHREKRRCYNQHGQVPPEGRGPRWHCRQHADQAGKPPQLARAETKARNAVIPTPTEDVGDGDSQKVAKPATGKTARHREEESEIRYRLGWKTRRCLTGEKPNLRLREKIFGRTSSSRAIIDLNHQRGSWCPTPCSSLL
jgi:hypothetical protein